MEFQALGTWSVVWGEGGGWLAGGQNGLSNMKPGPEGVLLPLA